MHAPPTLVGPPAAAAFLNVCVPTVRSMIKRGELRAYRVGKQWRIRLEDLHALVGGAAE